MIHSWIIWMFDSNISHGGTESTERIFLCNKFSETIFSVKNNYQINNNPQSASFMFLRALCASVRNLFFIFLLFSQTQKSQAQILIDSIYKKDFKVFIHDIVIEGNKKTKEQIIFRQLTFKKGDSISFSNLQTVLNESKQYIINTGLFYNVTLNIRNWEGSNMDIFISLEERLYTYPIPTVDIFDRNFNAWFVEHNHDGKRLQYGIRFLQMNMRGAKIYFLR